MRSIAHIARQRKIACLRTARTSSSFDEINRQPTTLLLWEDMPPDADHPSNRPTKEIRIPVMLSAAR